MKPLHKGGDRVSPSNYRPISLLPVCSKLLEKCVQQQLSSHLHSNDLLFPYQSGFRPMHSIQTLLLHCLDDWYLDRKQYVGVVFLDISKAFDIVNHDLLLAKLSQIGLSPSATAWFKSYLSDHSLVTRVGDSSSSLGFPTSGVPQGSVLGPSLFSAFINDLPSVLPPDSTVLFTDDTAIYIISNNIPSLDSSLQICLNLANLWIAKNGLKLNTSKTKCMLLHSPKKKLDVDLNLEIDSTAVEQVQVFKYLGVLINNTLTRRLSWFLPQSLLLLYFKSYILPHFDYCDVVWAGCTQKDSHRLETLLNFGCKIVLRRCRASSSAIALRDLGLTTLSSRKKLHMAQCMFRCLSSHSPPYLSRLFSSASSHYTTRFSSTCQFNLLQSKLRLVRKPTALPVHHFGGRCQHIFVTPKTIIYLPDYARISLTPQINHSLIYMNHCTACVLCLTSLLSLIIQIHLIIILFSSSVLLLCNLCCSFWVPL